jgi:hypothetical protein
VNRPGAHRWRTAIAACCAFGTAGCAPVGATGGPEPAVAGTFRDAVVRIGAFSNVSAIAVSPQRAFVVADGGLAIYDRNRRSWLPPLQLGFAGPRSPLVREPCAAATNLIGDALWIACASRVMVVRPALGAVWATDVGQRVSALAVDRSGADAYALGRTVVVVSASGTARPLAPGEAIPAERIAARVPVGGDPVLLQTVADPLLLRDDALRVWQPSAVARGDAGDAWVGTRGGGVFLADVDFHRSRQLPFGLRAGIVRSVSRTATGIIAVEEPAPWSADRSLVTTASDDLASWGWPSLYTSLGALTAAVAREGTLCMAGELGAGLANLSPLDASPTAPLTNDHRIFEPATTAIATRRGCVVGTERSIVVIPWRSDEETRSNGELQAAGVLPPVRALAASGDTIWIGTIGGLYRASDSTLRPVLVAMPPSVSPNVVALAVTVNGLAVATSSELWIGSGDRRTAGFARPTGSLARLGRLAALTADDRTIWVGGSNGATAIAYPAGPAVEVPLDEPSSMVPPPLGGREVRSIALAPGVAWVATSAGLVRVRRGPDGLPR